VSEDEEYRFSPEDFENGADPTDGESNRAPLVIVGCLGIGVGLFLAKPFVGPIAVSGVELDLAVLAAVVFSLGLFAGSVVYVGQGRVRLGVVHAVGALGWLLVVLGTAASSAVALVAGGGALVLGTATLIALMRYSGA